MTPLHRVLVAVIGIALVAILVGLIVRGRWRLVWCFAAYVALGVAVDGLLTFWPRELWTRPFWVAETTLASLLQLGIALEVGWRTFRVFPGAKWAARRVALAVVAATTIMLIIGPTFGPGFDPFLAAVGQFYSRLNIGTLLLIAAILALARCYRVPVHPFHAAVLTSLAVYLAYAGTLLTLVGVHGYGALILDPNILDALAFATLALWWSHVAWRPTNETAIAHDEVLRRLQVRTSPVGGSVSARADLLGNLA